MYKDHIEYSEENAKFSTTWSVKENQYFFLVEIVNKMKFDSKNVYIIL